MSYYTSVIILSWLALGVLCILVKENDRLSPKEKRQFYLTYLIVALSALAEWAGLRLNGHPEQPEWALRAVKCADYVLTPLAGGALVAQFRHNSLWKKLIFGLLAFNVLFQLVSAFTGWMLRIGADGRYSHGPLYPIYMGLYLLLILLVIVEFISYGRSFRRQNRLSIYAILLLAVVGILIQELLGGEYRTAYLTLTLGMSLTFIHISEFSQLAADDRMAEQRILITTDPLTGVASRFAYNRALQELDAAGALPKRLAAFSIDVNGLKRANDSLGHAAGDELIVGAAECITAALGRWGTCYRTGGDEFIVLADIDPEQVPMALGDLAAAAAGWHGTWVNELHLAAGCATVAENPGLSAEKLVNTADQAMYAEKSKYYRAAGLDRRRRSDG